MQKKIDNKIKRLLLLIGIVLLVVIIGLVFGLFDGCNVKISSFYLENTHPVFSENVRMYVEFDNKCDKEIHLEIYEGANLLFFKDTSRTETGYNWRASKDGGYELIAKVYVSGELVDAKKLIMKIEDLKADSDGTFRIYKEINAKKLIVNANQNYTNAIINVENAKHEPVFVSIVNLNNGKTAIEFNKYLEAGYYKISTATNSKPINIFGCEISGI